MSVTALRTEARGHRCVGVMDAPLAAIPAPQVEEAGRAGAAVAFGHVGEALALTRALRAAALLVPGAERRAGAGWGQIRDHTV